MPVRRSIALGSLLVSLIACDPSHSSDASAAEQADETAQALNPSSVRWVLDWTPGETTQLVNDLGYRVRIDGGWIGSWGVTLVECSSADAPTLGPGSPELSDIASLGLIAEGHSSGEDDPSAWVFAGVESLVDPAIVESETIALDGARYCQAHYLLAPISDASVGYEQAVAALALLDPELSLAGASVVIVGSWEPPGGGEPTPFVLRSEQGYGKLLDLELDTELDTAQAGAIEAVVRREHASMFDEIDFATADPDDASWQLLGNLARHSAVELQAE